VKPLATFHGGIHPPENKAQSTVLPIANAGLPDELVLPLSQHIGAPARPCVEPGQQVLKGECIATAATAISAPLHAPTSGTISAIEERPVPHPSGGTGLCIVIRPDGEQRWAPRHACAAWQDLPRDQLLAQIREAGIVGLGGAGFPTAVKAGTRPDRIIDTLIINAAECEPYITADDMLMRERAAAVVSGIEILRHLVQPATILIGIEDNKPEAIAALQAATGNSGIQVVTIPTLYPSGGEKQLIKILTAREVPSGGLPADIGVLCQNVGTAVAIHDAVVEGRPLISRITTVTGASCQQPRNYEVLIGTPVSHLLALAGWDAKRCDRVIIGGPMMGFSVPDAAVPVVKTTNCILAPTREELPPPPPAQACIRCGLCAEACPASLLPQQLYWFARSGEHDKLEAHHLFDCIECGACSYVCPSSIPLVQYYRASKAEIRHKQREREQAERARQRFEARQERMAREAAEREARRQARAAAAAAAQAAKARADAEARPEAPIQPAADPVQAAIERARALRAGQTGDSSAASSTAPSPRQQAEQKVSTLEARLTKARKRHEEAVAGGEKTAAALASVVEKLEQQLAAARAELETTEEQT
jgi:electron transport complex protein RnfC